MKTIYKTLAGLELRTAEATKCDWCRAFVTTNQLVYTPPATDPENALEVVCRWCGWRVVYSVAKETPLEREALRLIFCMGPEERFRDPRVYAAIQWFPHRTRGRKYLASYRKMAEGVKAIEEGTFKPRRSAVRPDRDKMPQSKAEKQAAQGKAEKQALKERAWAFQRRMLAEEKKRFGPYTFQLPAQIKAIESEVVPSAIFPGDRVGHLARLALKDFRIVELCEVALWGAALPETAEALAELRPVVAALEEEERRKAEERAREEREREERWQRQREEESARVMARTGAPSIAAAMGISGGRTTQDAAPVSRFRKDGGDSTPPARPLIALGGAELTRSVVIPEADQVCNSIPVESYDPNHPDAVQFQRSTAPDPTRGLTIDDLDAERARGDTARRYYRGEYYDGDRRY